MLKIKELNCEGRFAPIGIPCSKPSFGWKLESDLPDTVQKSCRICVCSGGGVIWDSSEIESDASMYIPCGAELLPHTEYTVKVNVTDNHGQTAAAEDSFFSGKLSEPWEAKWIGTEKKNDRKNSLPPEMFKKTILLSEKPVRAVLYASAMGIYEAEINGKRVGNSYFVPGYTHYQTYLQFQSYDVTHLMDAKENDLRFTVANGWWLGSSGNKNNRYGNHRGLIAELHIWDSDGCHSVISTDESWLHIADTPTRYADFYNGETIDETKRDEARWRWEKAIALSGVKQKLIPHFGAFVTEDQRLSAVRCSRDIYDFGQNHAGILHLKVDASKGTAITIRHGEILNDDGSLFTQNLRKAKQTLHLICGTDGEQEFSPRFTFMGFRYAEIKADRPIKLLGLESIVLTSNAPPIGSFSCSNPLLTRLQQNIQWSQRSNFIDIPTDCPQRDERMGWTGDIAVFASTAAYNRNISAFMNKWLYDLRLDQRNNGAIPMTVPENRTYEPTPFSIPTAIWGDAAVIVPWAVYIAYGDRAMLERQYNSMKAYVNAELRIAMRSDFPGHRRYLWDNNLFQYGDWCAPGESLTRWMKKGKYLSTAFMANSVNILRQTANILGKQNDEAHYSQVLDSIKEAFAKHCILPDGRLTGDFQSNYVCALYFGLVPETKKPAAAKRLAELVREKKHLIQTGFAGTPYIAFALADNGYVEDAYSLLLNEACPGWLYTIKAGGTTTWERWDALDESGRIKRMGKNSQADMVSFNHYAYGAVGDFFYRRILGIEPITAGYQEFSVKPIPGGTLAHAEGSLETGYGRIEVAWKRENGRFSLNVTVPVNTRCKVVLPDGSLCIVGSGKHEYTISEEKKYE